MSDDRQHTKVQPSVDPSGDGRRSPLAFLLALAAFLAVSVVSALVILR